METIRTPEGWTTVSRSPNRHAYQKEGYLGSEELQVIKDTRDGRWYVQTKDTGRFFSDDELDVVAIKQNKTSALRRAAEYMRRN